MPEYTKNKSFTKKMATIFNSTYIFPSDYKKGENELHSFHISKMLYTYILFIITVFFGDGEYGICYVCMLAHA